MENNQQGETFLLDYLGKYYFYEEDEFKTKFEEADKILKHIEEYSRYQEGDHAFTKSKFGNVTESYTEKNVEILVPFEGDTIGINGEKRHLDLAYKMEMKSLEDHVRIATRLIEEGQSISSLLYINHKQAEQFVAALERLKNQ